MGTPLKYSFFCKKDRVGSNQLPIFPKYGNKFALRGRKRNCCCSSSTIKLDLLNLTFNKVLTS